MAIMQQYQLSQQGPVNKSSSVSTFEKEDILSNIEKLQYQLKVSVGQIAATVATQSSSAVNAGQTDKIQDFGSETETEDDDNDKEQFLGEKRDREVADEDEDDGRKVKRPMKTNEVEEKKLALVVAEYLECVKTMVAMEEEAEKEDLNNFKRICNTAMAKLIKFIEHGGIPSVETATAFRDATILLPAIVEKHAFPKIQKWLVLTKKTITQVSALGRINAKLPTPLVDPQLEVSRMRLYQRGFCFTDYKHLEKMEAFVSKMTAQPRALEPESAVERLNELARMYRSDIRLYASRQKSGNRPPRTEEHWDVFLRVSKVLTQWIHQAELASPTPKLQGILGKFDRELRGFAEKFPGRVPESLLEASPVLTRFARLQAPQNTNRPGSRKRS